MRDRSAICEKGIEVLIMGSLFNLDNPIWRFMGKLVDVFILTLLWAVCCIPIITIGPASTAVYYVTLKLVRDEES